MFALSSFWMKEGNMKNNEESKQFFKRNVLTQLHTSYTGTEYLPDSRPCASFVLE